MWHRILAGVALVVVAYGVYVYLGNDAAESPTVAPAPTTAAAPNDPEPGPSTPRDTDSPAANAEPDDPAEPYFDDAGGETWFVTHNYDGDTFVVDGGTFTEEVRMIGIDTPEIGQCGYEEAQRYLRDRIVRLDVTLVPGATTDRDNYDRLLRYVQVDGSDVGLELIYEGLAHARYDSRSGKPHPREELYRTADDLYPHICD